MHLVGFIIRSLTRCTVTWTSNSFGFIVYNCTYGCLFGMLLFNFVLYVFLLLCSFPGILFYCVVLCIIYVQKCTVLLLPVVNPTAVIKYIISTLYLHQADVRFLSHKIFTSWNVNILYVMEHSLAPFHLRSKKVNVYLPSLMIKVPDHLYV
jgi:hypothetical protein